MGRKLQDIPKERKGLYLETYQTAIHTNREIFIDSTSYNAMEKVEKAKLLLHEMVMSHYLLKYLSIEDMCKFMNNCSGDYAMASRWKMFRPEPYRPLNEQDHQKIRAVTSWLWENKDSVTDDTFYKILKNNDFDKRFADQAMRKTEINKEYEIPVETFIRTLKKYQYSGSFPKYCAFEGPTITSVSECKTDISAEVQDAQTHPTVQMKNLVVKVKITRAKDGKALEQEFKYPLASGEKQVLNVYISSMGAGLTGAPVSLMSGLPGFSGIEMKEGVKTSMLFLVLDLKDPENPEIFQMMFQTSVWYSFVKKEFEKDGRKVTQTIGYNAPLPDESETLFIEKELPFQLKIGIPSPMVLQSVEVPL